MSDEQKESPFTSGPAAGGSAELVGDPNLYPGRVCPAVVMVGESLLLLGVEVGACRAVEVRY